MTSRTTILSVSWHSRKDAVLIEPREGHAMISITEPGETAPLKKGWIHLLRLGFHDLEGCDDDSGYTLFSQDMASQVIDWLDSIQGKVGHIHIHCYAGISRSAGVARFIADRYGLPFNRKYDMYNRLVNRMLLAEDAWRVSKKHADTEHEETA